MAEQSGYRLLLFVFA